MKRSLLCLLGLLLLCSCDKKYESSIPDTFVDIELYLSQEDWRLTESLSHKTFTQIRPPYIRAIGFGGVIVYHGLSTGSIGNDYYAFDMACPHEAHKGTLVEVDDSNIHAICPKCGSKFELIYGVGNPVSGPAKYPLKTYPTTKIADKLYIRYIY